MCYTPSNLGHGNCTYSTVLSVPCGSRIFVLASAHQLSAGGCRLPVAEQYRLPSLQREAMHSDDVCTVSRIRPSDMLSYVFTI